MGILRGYMGIAWGRAVQLPQGPVVVPFWTEGSKTSFDMAVSKN